MSLKPSGAQTNGCGSNLKRRGYAGFQGSIWGTGFFKPQPNPDTFTEYPEDPSCPVTSTVEKEVEPFHGVDCIGTWER